MAARNINDNAIRPKFPDKLPVDSWSVVYFEPSDILTVHFSGEPVPAISVPAEDDLSGLYWRVDDASRRVVGLEITNFLSSFLRQHPEAAPLAERAGLPSERIQQAIYGVGSGSEDQDAFGRITAGVRDGKEVVFA